MYTQLIWDWNGTLFNDTWLCHEIMNNQLAKIGKSTISYDQYLNLFSFPVRTFYEKIGFDFLSRSYESVAQNFIHEYTSRRFECELHIGVSVVLEKLRGYDCVHSVLSAYDQQELVNMLGHYQLLPYFSNVIGLDNHYASGKVEEGKILLKRIGADLSTVILIGDTVHDFDVAQQLGINVVLISHGHNSQAKLSKCSAPVVNSFAEAMLHIL